MNNMKIAFILSYGGFAPTNGIISQGLTWKKGLEELGHEIVLINMWDRNDWKSFNSILFFGFNVYACEFINVVSKVNPNIVVAPILDPNYSITTLKIYSYWGSHKLRLTNPFYSLRNIKNKIKIVLVRSEFEKKYMVKGFGFPTEKCKIVRLSCGIMPLESLPEKEAFCLHISLLCDERKNVRRLIDAAKKYKFRLVLAGKLRNQEEQVRLNSWIDNASNIEYRGFISNEEKIDLYTRAKVFALPSTNEGVGIVALEAAAMGCDIVITKLGGPHEYYGNKAKIVNPYNIDEIGTAVRYFIDGGTFQPQLKSLILQNYSLRNISQILASAIKC
ncbi:glycosyltransferase family 4 protein [Coprobacter fastidiosus]|uniref:glycosyltransferase family 4 protein n=1 Tax=Coprobacter fastidiosus TaxID=1099853 RepID=UPI0026704B29|nr:glycosyltransferase family 4 protein [Coprobacter fastidiosus]